jgi:hypothetical protein
VRTTTCYLFLLSGLIISLFSACEKSLDKNTTKIKYGFDYGLVAAYTRIQLTADLFLYEQLLPFEPSKTNCSLPAEEDRFRDILNAVDYKAFQKLPDTFGCPNCADGGAEFIEVERDGVVKRVTYEAGKVPDELKEVEARIKLVLESFKDCGPEK